MKKVWITKKYDLRPTDPDTGKKIAIPASMQKECQCCGKKIVKITVLNTGHEIGSECAEVIALLGSYSPSFLGATNKQADFYTLLTVAQ